MPTWGQYQAQAELKANRAAQDIVLRERHRNFDLQAQDKTPKSARHHFAVVGEGSRTSQENYRQQYEKIFGLPSRSQRSSHPRASSNVGPDAGTAG